MSRCKLTTMNLRNIRKSREYQCLLIDLVKMGVVGKSAAESILGYTIPAGLLGNTTPDTPVDDDGDEEDTQPLVTVVYNSATELVDELDLPLTQFSYNLNDGATDEDILAAAREEFNNNALNSVNAVNLAPNYAKDDPSGTEVISYGVDYRDEVSAYEAGMILIVTELMEEDPGRTN